MWLFKHYSLEEILFSSFIYLFFFKNTYFKRAEKELHLIPHHGDPSALAMASAIIMFSAYEVSQERAFFKSTEMFLHPLPWSVFSSAVTCCSPTGPLCCETVLWPGPGAWAEGGVPSESKPSQPLQRVHHILKWWLGCNPGAEVFLFSNTPWLLILGLRR